MDATSSISGARPQEDSEAPIASTSGTSRPSKKRANQTGVLTRTGRTNGEGNGRPTKSSSLREGQPGYSGKDKKREPRIASRTTSDGETGSTSTSSAVASGEKERQPMQSSSKDQRKDQRKLRKTQSAFFLRQLEEHDRAIMTDEEYASSDLKRQSEADSRANLVNLPGVKKPKSRTLRRKCVDDLRAAGIEARSPTPEPNGKTTGNAIEVEEEPLLNSKGQPMSKQGQLTHILHKQTEYFRGQLDEEARRTMTVEAFESAAKQRSKEAGKRARLVNKPGPFKAPVRALREKYINELRSAGVRLRSPSPDTTEQEQALEAAAEVLRDKLDAGYEEEELFVDVEEERETARQARRKQKKQDKKEQKQAAQLDAQLEEKEEGELGLGDLFFVDTAPADLPDELRKTKEVQDEAKEVAKAEGVPLDLHLRDDAAVPDYVDGLSAPQSIKPASRKGKERAIDQDEAMSESDSSSAHGSEPGDLALNVQSVQTTDTEAQATEDIEDMLDFEEDDADKSMRAVNRYFKEDNPDLHCGRCGEQGHTVKNCEHIICLTCGKLDDHDSKACPLNMTCFRCGSRGHHIRDCPVDAAHARPNRWCERCSSKLHMSINCPYIWRVYIRAADAPANPPAYNFNCYNCASNKHFGDDCPKPRGHPAKLVDRSAFTIDQNRRYDNRPSEQQQDYQNADEYDRTPYNMPSGMPRPNIVNGKRMPLPPLPRNDMSRHQIRSERRDFQKEVEDAKRSQSGADGGRDDRSVDFGDLNGIDSREDDEEEDFAKRLKNDSGTDGKGSKPGARDRRAQREADAQRAPRDAGYQPFKNFTEPGRRTGDSASERGSVRSRSVSPQGRRRHQPPPSPMREREKVERVNMDSVRYRGPPSLADRLDRDDRSGRYDSDRSSQGRRRSRSRSPPPRQSHRPARDNLLDRIQSARNERDFPRGSDRRGYEPRGSRNDDLARGDDFVSFGSHGGGSRESGDRYSGQGSRYAPRGPSRQPNSGGRYRGGYV